MSIEREMKRLMKYEIWSVDRWETEYVVTIYIGRGEPPKGNASRLDWAISRAIKEAKEKS